jgi:hypothetical protein
MTVDMKNFEVLEQRHQEALAREARTRDEILQAQARKDAWKTQMLEMDAQFDHQHVISLAAEIAEISRRRTDIDRFENETGLPFDALGPALTACEKCQALFQFRDLDHVCK